MNTSVADYCTGVPRYLMTRYLWTRIAQEASRGDFAPHPHNGEGRARLSRVKCTQEVVNESETCYAISNMFAESMPNPYETEKRTTRI